jgi:hypothetical protein
VLVELVTLQLLAHHKVIMVDKEVGQRQIGLVAAVVLVKLVVVGLSVVMAAQVWPHLSLV